MRHSYSGSSVRGARIQCASLRCRRALGVCRHALTSIGLTCSTGRWPQFRTGATRRALRRGRCGLDFESHRCSISTEHTKMGALLSWPRTMHHTFSCFPVSPLTSSSGRAARLREVRFLTHMMRPNHALQRTAAERRGCNRRVSWPPSLSLGRSVDKSSVGIVEGAGEPDLESKPDKVRFAVIPFRGREPVEHIAPPDQADFNPRDSASVVSSTRPPNKSLHATRRSVFIGIGVFHGRVHELGVR